MARNVEIKARVDSLGAVAERIASMADSGPISIDQDDTFFACAAGRLKLRSFSANHGELIFYRRADQIGPKESFYLRSPTDDPQGLRACLTAAHGEIGRVIKQRQLYWAGRTRVHLDRVQGLGDFVELEVVLAPDEPAAAGVREAHTLMAQLGLQKTQLVKGAYVDLLTNITSSQ